MLVEKIIQKTMKLVFEGYIKRLEIALYEVNTSISRLEAKIDVMSQRLGDWTFMSWCTQCKQPTDKCMCQVSSLTQSSAELYLPNNLYRCLSCGGELTSAGTCPMCRVS